MQLGQQLGRWGGVRPGLGSFSQIEKDTWRRSRIPVPHDAALGNPQQETHPRGANPSSGEGSSESHGPVLLTSLRAAPEKGGWEGKEKTTLLFM